MDKLLDFLANNTGISVLIIICIMIIFITLIGSILFLLLKGKFKAKIAGQEIGVNIDGTDKNQDKKSTTIELNSNNISFINVLSVIIESAVESGYRRSVKRQELFDSQIKNTRSRLNLVITKILNEYIKVLPKGNFNTVQIVLNYLFDIKVINELERIYQQDKLSEKSKEQILEINKPFINGITDTLLFEVQKFVNSNKSDFDDKLYTIVEKYSDEIRNAVIGSLEDAYRDALCFLNELNYIKDDFTKHITNVLTSYDPNIKKHENLPKSWDDTMPPNSIVGSV